MMLGVGSSGIKKIALLKGGWNAERTVSLQSAAAVRVALDELGYDVQEIDITPDLNILIRCLENFKPDLVYLNALHGQYVEDGKIQSVMEILGYPYTGSDVAASAMSMDKSITRNILESCGISIPKGLKCRSEILFSCKLPMMPMPFVIKPLSEGSSIGVSIIRSERDLLRAADEWCYGDQIIVEEYIAGHEFSVALMNNKPLGILELKPKEGFYDFQAKYTTGFTKHIIPTDLDPQDREQILTFSAQAVEALGVKGISRVDLRYDSYRDPGQRVYVIELNTLPGLTSLSIVPEIAQTAGFNFNQLINWTVQNPKWPIIHHQNVVHRDKKDQDHLVQSDLLNKEVS